MHVIDPQNILPVDKIYLGSKCQTLLLDHNSEFAQEIRYKCLHFYVKAIEEMIKRLPFNDIIFRSLNFLDFKIALGDEGVWFETSLISPHVSAFSILQL